MASFSRTTWVSRHQKGETSLDFDEVRRGGVVVASAEPYASHLYLAVDRKSCQHLTPFLPARR